MRCPATVVGLQVTAQPPSAERLIRAHHSTRPLKLWLCLGFCGTSIYLRLISVERRKSIRLISQSACNLHPDFHLPSSIAPAFRHRLQPSQLPFPSPRESREPIEVSAPVPPESSISIHLACPAALTATSSPYMNPNMALVVLPQQNKLAPRFHQDTRSHHLFTCVYTYLTTSSLHAFIRRHNG